MSITLQAKNQVLKNSFIRDVLPKFDDVIKSGLSYSKNCIYELMQVKSRHKLHF